MRICQKTSKHVHIQAFAQSPLPCDQYGVRRHEKMLYEPGFIDI
jgi:hypothetical protein